MADSGLAESAEKAAEAVSESVAAAREKFTRLSDDVQQRYKQVSKDVRRGAERATKEIRKSAEAARDTYRDTANKVQKSYKRTRSEVNRMSRDVGEYVRENPGKAVLMAAGTKGKRTLLPNSRILIHQPWLSGLQGQQSDIEIHAKDMWMMRDRMDEILAYHTGKTKEEVHRDTERDRILAAPEALAYGLADRVMSRRGPSGTGPGPGPIGAVGPSGAIWLASSSCSLV